MPPPRAEQSRGRQQARSIVLSAQREAHEELRGQVLDAARGLRDEPGYERLLRRLTAMASRAAGPDATVTTSPAGGVVARSREVLVDCTLPRLAGLAVDALGDQVRELWTLCSDGAARVARVNGPLVEVTGLTEVAMYDIIELGVHQLPGEAVAIRGDVTTVQAYEYTGGLAPGHPARSRGEPLSARLGPHLLGGIFDGLLRPLSGAPAWLEPGYPFTLDQDQEFEFTPQAQAGAVVGAGASLGMVAVAGGIAYRVLVPPGLSGTALLAEADRLSSLAELMGVAALPPRERATMLAGRLIREGLLQQSALSSVDASCDTARAAALSGAVLAVAERCRQLADAGVPPAALEELDFSRSCGPGRMR